MNIDGGKFIALQTVEHPDAPPVKKVIRMYNHDISFLKQEGPNVKMIDVQFFNLKGKIPSTIMNMMISASTTQEFVTMMKHIHSK